jgi:hypothetical protein
MKPLLSDVTICAADCITSELAILAIKKSMEQCQFAEAILFSDCEPTSLEGIRFIAIDKMKSRDDYSRFILKELHLFIKTRFVLIVQWDGYVVDGSKWEESFTSYDYIGAKWNWHTDGKTVGNGGFSLRSKRLLDIASSDDFPFVENMPEDDQICRTYRDRLEAHGIKFASEEVADRFSHERGIKQYDSFGFHGIFNFWRYITENEVKVVVPKLHLSTFKSKELKDLLIEALINRRFSSFRIIFKRVLRDSPIFFIVKFFFHLTKRTLGFKKS